MDEKGCELRIFKYKATCIYYVFQYHIICDKAMLILQRQLKIACLRRTYQHDSFLCALGSQTLTARRHALGQ